MHAFFECDTEMTLAEIKAGTHGDSVTVAFVRVVDGAPQVELTGVAATVDAARLVEAISMASEVLAG